MCSYPNMLNIDQTSGRFFSSVDEVGGEESVPRTVLPHTREEAPPAAPAPPASVIISSEVPAGKSGTKPQTQSSTNVMSKQGSRVLSDGTSHLQSLAPQDSELTATPKEKKPVDVKPNASIFLQTAAFLLEVNAFPVKLVEECVRSCPGERLGRNASFLEPRCDVCLCCVYLLYVFVH